jgi:hypothetical protein
VHEGERGAAQEERQVGGCGAQRAQQRVGLQASLLDEESAALGPQLADGFEVMGREPGAEERGCSIAADELLAGDGA